MRENSKALLNYLKLNAVNFKEQVELQKFSYFKSGGMIACLILPAHIEQVQTVIKYLYSNNISYRIFGNTTNCIFTDDLNIDIVISLKRLKNIFFDYENNTISVEAGALLPKFVIESSKKSITGFEGLEGIPGTIGGALIMNAGAYGYSISDHLIKVRCIDNNGMIKTYEKEELDFSFRDSLLKKNNEIILDAIFELKRGTYSDIEQKVLAYKKHRKSVLEYRYPNVGSVFASHDIYKEIAKHHLGYRVLLHFVRGVIHRLLRIKNNRLLNRITFWYFGMNMDCDIVSEKTMNTVINTGCPTQAITRYIESVKKICRDEIRMEIELL